MPPRRDTWPAEARIAEATLANRVSHLHAANRVLEKYSASLERQLPSVSVREPMTYRYGGEFSFFYDAARARRGSKAAEERLARHEREMDTELSRRAEQRASAAAQYEAAFASDPAGYEALSRMERAGIRPFEQRALTRTPGQGGLFTPPVYLVDQYVPFAREASPFATTWSTMDLPLKTSEINVPRLALGAATGPQSDAGPAPSRDIQDSLVTVPVKTVAGIADASMQWLEQGSGSGGYGVDQMLFADLTADLAQNVDGQCLLGSGTGQQLLGVWPGGSIAAASGIVVADTTATVWTAAAGTASIHVQLKQTASLLRRLRARSDDLAWYWHPWVWELYLAQVDLQDRPLYHGCEPASLPTGAVGHYQGVPVWADTNIPTTFGGATLPPQMGAYTNGQYAAVPGAGTGASYTPLLLARPSDLYLFQGKLQMQLLSQVLSGNGMVRFQIFQYLAAMPNRYVAAAASGSNVSAGGDVAHATFTSQHSGSALILAGSGY